MKAPAQHGTILSKEESSDVMIEKKKNNFNVENLHVVMLVTPEFNCNSMCCTFTDCIVALNGIVCVPCISLLGSSEGRTGASKPQWQSNKLICETLLLRIGRWFFLQKGFRLEAPVLPLQ